MAGQQWGSPGRPGNGPPAPQHYLPPRLPPRRGRGGLLGVLIAVTMGAVAVGMVLVALVVSEREQSAAHQPGAASPAAPGGASTGPGGAAPAPANPTASPPDPPGSGGGDHAGTSRGAAADNRVYQAGALPVTGCRGQAIAPDDPASMERFLHATTDCLDRSWKPALARQGVSFDPPKRVFWTTPGRSPCGDYPSAGTAAFYCALNNSVYIGIVHVQKAAGGMPVKWNVAYARGVAHEYAHHVQETTGILEWSRGERMAAPGLEERNAITRRSELQAQCFAGVFMASVRGSFPVTPDQWQITIKDSTGRGDDGRPADSRDHGSGQHYVQWMRLGFTRNTTAVCNTWTVPDTEVS